MKKPTIYIAIICAAIIAMPITFNVIGSLQKADIVIDMPKDYKIGELVTLDASKSKAENLIWKIVPETPNFKVNDKIAFFSATEPIDFTIIVSGHYNNSLVCKTFELKYRKEVVIDEKEKEKKVVLTPFELEVKGWLTTANLTQHDRGAALRLAQSFKTVARTIEGGVYETTDNVILATAYANKNALGSDLEAWKPFLRQFQNYLETNPPTTVNSHIQIWDNMGKALETVFKC